jgi:glutathionylspermidine synthase
LRRIKTTPRLDWKHRLDNVGFVIHSSRNGAIYWDESAYWAFSEAEVKLIFDATKELERLSREAVSYLIRTSRLQDFGISAESVPAVEASWKSQPPSLYGRVDLAFDGQSIKLLEYNADTPTGLVEAAIAQWYWLQDCFPNSDQFNSLHEKLIAKWKDLKDYVTSPVYFSDGGSLEDRMTVEYLRDTANQAALKSLHIAMRDIGWNAAHRCFVDLDNRPIGTLFKLYPWEWMLSEPFGANALSTLPPESPLQEYGPRKDRRSWGSTLWIEPIWKMMWSNKALLAILWELNPGHELLLPAYLDGPRTMQSYVRKPLLGREGSGIAVVRDGQVIAGSLDGEGLPGYVWQELAPMAESDGKTAVFGSWLIDGEPAGMGIRESSGPVTNNTSCFVPHIFR